MQDRYFDSVSPSNRSLDSLYLSNRNYEFVSLSFNNAPLFHSSFPPEESVFQSIVKEIETRATNFWYGLGVKIGRILGIRDSEYKIPSSDKLKETLAAIDENNLQTLENLLIHYPSNYMGYRAFLHAIYQNKPNSIALILKHCPIEKDLWDVLIEKTIIKKRTEILAQFIDAPECKEAFSKNMRSVMTYLEFNWYKKIYKKFHPLISEENFTYFIKRTIQKEDNDILKFLIDEQPLESRKWDMNYLSQCIEKNNIEGLKLLLSSFTHIPKIDIKYIIRQQLGDKKPNENAIAIIQILLNSAFFYMNELNDFAIESVRHNKMDVFQYLYTNYSINPSYRDSMMLTIAAEEGLDDFVELLLIDPRVWILPPISMNH